MLKQSCSSRPMRRIAVFGVVMGLLSAASAARAADAGGLFSGLSGTWAGEGTVTLANGSNERIRCHAVYSVPPVGTALNQGLRCASASYTFDVKSYVTVAGDGSVSGTWSELTRQVTGDVTGHASRGQIQTSVETLGFSAQLSVVTRGSRQSVSIAPQGTDVRAVTIEMKRI